MNELFDKYIKRILNARVYDISVQTRLHQAETLSERIGNRVLLKREDEQPVFSFKCRGAFNRIYRLTQRNHISGVVAASAGNHAQGVALAASTLGLKATIVMPVTTPAIKVDSVRRFGGEAVMHGDDFQAAYQEAVRIGEAGNFPFIHPFDDIDTIAGQGTVGMEICQQYKGDLDAIFVPIGGGGLAAGLSVYMKYVRPDVRIIGVEPVDSACMKAAIDAGAPVELDEVGLFADGVAVRQAGRETFEVCRHCLDDIVLVTVDEISAAIKDIFYDTRIMTEPAGACAVAGLKKYAAAHSLSDKSLVAVCSGANINFDRLRHVAERAEIGESRESLMAVTIPERPGSFLEFCSSLGRRSITEFNYRYADDARARVFVGVELSGGQPERQSILESLRTSGYEVLDMTDNELAILHVRHMIGGHAGSVKNERLIRFQFPERPGALIRFLKSLGSNWNITLFHYRNHGAAFGRVLIGMQIPESDQGRLDEVLQRIGYRYREETGNPAYQQFLS